MAKNKSHRIIIVESFCGVLLLISMANCTFRQSDQDQAPEYRVEFSAFPDPAMVGSAVLGIEIFDEDGSPVDSIALSVRGDMTHAGMTPVIEDAESAGAGHYQADFEWTMAGSWIITLKGTLPDGRILIRTFSIDVEPESP